jgi:hypothetical protein
MKVSELHIWLILSLLPFHSLGQEILEYHKDIQPILAKHCYSCHYPDGPGPFDLTQIDQVMKRAKFIAHVTKIKYMPPWKADLEFGEHKNARHLTDDEISIIQNWVDNGKKVGKKKSKAKKIVSKGTLDKSWTHIKMGKEYSIPYDRKDDFRFFYLPYKNKKVQYITGIEFIPGNKKRVHHSRIMADTTGTLAGLNGMSEYDHRIYEYQKYPLADEFLYGWVPGNFTFKFPKGFGKKLYEGTDFILNIHYSPSSIPDTDLSSLKISVEDSINIKREVKTLIFRENDIANQPFEIPANTEKTFYLNSGLIPYDISLLTVQPHAHLLGKSFRAYAITPDGSLIPLIKIEKWDFNWQTTYEFSKLIHIPKGSVIYFEGTYDNTDANIENPNQPPRDVGYGWRTVDEMMNLIMYYTEYQEGDEFLDLDY